MPKRLHFSLQSDESDNLQSPLQNRLFVAYKPASIGSNRFLSQIKRRYGVKKAGFSGTLDPFAKGVLIIAFGQYTKLFRYLKKAPKRYRATLWLGAQSPTLDIEKVSQISEVKSLDTKRIEALFADLIGQISYLPPKYSAKKIEGRRAYDLARADQDFELKTVESTIYELNLVHYTHPFLTFDITISEGGYVRSIAQIIAQRLETVGTLSALERVNEGDFVYQDELPLDPIHYLDLPRNRYLGDTEDILLGRKLKRSDFKIQNEGEYLLVYDTILSIIAITEDGVEYRLNGVKRC